MPNAKILPPERSAYLAHVPYRILRQIDPSTLLLDSLPDRDEQTKYAAVISFYRIQSTFAAAKRQRQRIARGEKAIQRLFARHHSRRRNRPTSSIFDDVHFYVICWSRLQKLSRFFAQRTRFPRVGCVLRRYHADFQHMTAARDHLEHFEERLPGGGKQKNLRAQGDLFNIAGNHMTFGGDRFDIGPNSLTLLRGFMVELQAAVVYDALDAIAENDKDLLVRRIQQAHRDAALPSTIKRAERAFAASRHSGASR